MEAYGVIVTFTHPPSPEVMSCLRSHAFRYLPAAGYWHRISTKHAGTVISAIRRLATMADAAPTLPQDAPEAVSALLDGQDALNQAVEAQAGHATCNETSR